jgi:hypothetical protein
VFYNALVNTVIIILQKHEGDSKKNIREKNLVKFVRIKKTQEIDKIISMMKALNQHEDDAMRVCSVMKKSLDSREKWGVYYFDFNNNT